MEQGGTISLLPESRRKLDISIPGENRPFYYGGAVLLLVLLIFGALKLYTSSLTGRLAEMENEINAIETQRDTKFEKEALLLNKQFSLVGDLLQKHLIWSNVLIGLQNLTEPQSQLKSVLGDATEGKMEITGSAATFTTVAKQIAALLSHEGVVDVSLNKVSTFSGGVLEYSVKVIFDKNKFLLNKE